MKNRYFYGLFVVAGCLAACSTPFATAESPQNDAGPSSGDATTSPGDSTATPDPGGPAFRGTMGALPLTTVTQGKTTQVTVQINRTNGYTGPAYIQVDGLPNGITANPITIAENANQGVLNLVADSPTQGTVNPPPTVYASRTANDTPTASTPLPLFVRGQAGSLDTTFGTDGRSIVVFPSATPYAIHALVSANDDSIYAATYCSSGTCIARLKPDGSLDNAYGTNGTAVSNNIWPLQDAVLLPDGRIVVGGSNHADNNLAGYSVVSANGTIGVPVTLNPTGANQTPGYGVQAMAVAPDGSIAIAFNVMGAFNNLTGIAKLTNALQLDPNFGTGGMTSVQFQNTGTTSMTGIAVRPGGKMVMVGRWVTGTTPQTYGYGILQLDARGAPDQTFGTDRANGRTLYTTGPQDDYVQGFVLLPDNRVISAVQSPPSSLIPIVAFKADGSGLDTTFGTDGTLSVACKRIGPSVIGDSQNRLLVTTDTESFESVSRYSTLGVLDPSFGANGNANPTPPSGFSSWQSVASRLQNDGRIVVFSLATQIAGNSVVVVSRLWN